MPRISITSFMTLRPRGLWPTSLAFGILGVWSSIVWPHAVEACGHLSFSRLTSDSREVWSSIACSHTNGVEACGQSCRSDSGLLTGQETMLLAEAEPKAKVPLDLRRQKGRKSSLAVSLRWRNKGACNESSIS